MSDLEQEIRKRFLDRLDDMSWDDEDPRMDFGIEALPYFVAAFNAETSSQRRTRLTCIIWQFRDPLALPALAVALNDPCDEVWREALDGIVALRGDQAREILLAARATAADDPTQKEKLEWIDEALTQVNEGF